MTVSPTKPRKASLASHASSLATLALATLGFFAPAAHATAESDLESSFLNPPVEVKPRTWMHAMSGNMSKVGMTKDIEALHAAGQGGILLFNVANGIPYGDVPYNSDEHHEIITHAAAECERLGLSFGVHNCDGWTSSGGPWITAEQSMKMVVWSENVLDGGTIDAQLAQPLIKEGLYHDIATLAYPATESEILDATAKPVVTGSGEKFDASIMTDGWDASHTEIALDENGISTLTLDYGEMREMRSLYLAFRGNGLPGDFEISDDGETFTKVFALDKPTRLGKKTRIFNQTFDPIKSRYFRFSFKKPLLVKEVRLTHAQPYKNYLGYSGMGTPGPYVDLLTPHASQPIIKKDSIIDLSDSLDENGRLKAELPEGKWMVLRFGYTSTGARNWPASKWGIGLECDKFSREALKIHFDAFSQRVIDNAKKVAPNALQYLEIDSYEMGGQNWTDGFPAIFEEAKGYDIIPYLPVFAGRYVESPEAVAGIAFDLNEIYCDLMTQNYFRYFTELCHENGVLSYAEPYGRGPLSTLDASEFIDLPMTEFWMNRDRPRRLTGTIDGAHIYGRNVISAEAFTARPELNWKNHPALAKTWGDMSWVAGVNEFMFHRFVHQANTHVEPGLTMGFWGSHFDRTQTWWMNAGVEWFSYGARGSHLLRHGYPAADVLVFVGDTPHKDGLRRSRLAYKVPAGLNYDCTNANALLKRFTIEDKALVLPEGNHYKYLILQNMRITTLPTLRRIKEIVDAGIPVVGRRPNILAGHQRSDEEQQEFEALVAHIWSQPNCTTDFDFSKVQPAFSVAGIEKGFMQRSSDEADIFFFYNKKEEAVRYDCTFRVAGKIPELWNAVTGEITRLAAFSTSGNTTSLSLNLDGLESAFIVFRESADGVIPVASASADMTLSLADANTVRIQTQSPQAATLTWADGKKTEIPARAFPDTVELNTDWSVEFLDKRRYAATETFPTLSDWKDHEKDDIKHYSGSAIYTKTFTLDDAIAPDLRYILDLGEVDIVAEVHVNGQDAGTLWIAPFTTDITDYLKEGENTLEIQITNTWANRLIGDENYPRHDGYKSAAYNPRPDEIMPQWYVDNKPMPEGPRTTFSGHDFYKKGDPLEPSGLKGPVAIRYERVVAVAPGDQTAKQSIAAAQ